MSKRFTIEWRERGEWVRSQCRFYSESAATVHAEMIGAKTFRIVRAMRKKGKKRLAKP